MPPLKVNNVPLYLPLMNVPSTAITGLIHEVNPLKELPMAMKQYLKLFALSFSMNVRLPGFFFSTIAMYEGNKWYESAGLPLTISIANSLTIHAL